MSAGEVRAAVEAAFRDFVTDGVASSGPHEPAKSEIRTALGSLLETTLSAIGAGILRYATVALMEANTGAAAGQLAYVYANAGSPSDPANGVYQWSGSAWVIADWYFDAVAAVVQPLVDAAVDAAEAAAAEAASSAALSQESASTAEAAAGPTYASTAAGLAATASGEGFAVDNGDGTVTVYLNNAGVAVAQRTLATTAALAASGGSALVGFLQSGTGAATRTVQAKLRDIVSVKDFGAVGDGVTDDTAAFNAALTYLSANRINGRGLGKIRVPRGRYLCNGTITLASALSLIFEGDGVEASEIIRTSDTGDLFSFAPYIYLEFADLGISHVTGSNRSTWTTNCFALSGNGGGRELCLRRVQTKNFNRVVSFSYAGNEDTNYFEGCSFNNCKTFMYGRNGQGVVNKAVQCTWFGYIDRVFDISGYGYFHIDTVNVVQSGSFLYLNSAISGSASQYLVTNAKFEFWNGPNANNLLGTTKIVEMENSAANPAYLRLVNCGIAGGTPDPSVYQWDLQGAGYTVEVIGGQWGNTQVQTRARTAAGAHNAWWVAFRQLTTSPSRTINRIAGSAGAHHVPVLFNSCVGVENILLRGPGYAPGGNGRIAGIAADRNQNTKNNNGNLVSGNSTTTHSFSSYGQSTLVDRIRVVATVSIGWTGAEIKAFADAALTVQIGATLTPAGGTFSTPQVFEITVPAGTFTSDGVNVTVKNTNGGGAVEGFVFVDTLSV